MHDTYTILHLTPWTRVGLVCLSALLAALTLYATNRLHVKTRLVSLVPARRIAHFGIAFTMLWLFIWLSPQVYYQFYWAALSALPMQIVIGTPPSPMEIAGLLAIDIRADLPPIAQGLLGWSLLAQAVWHAVRR